MCRYYYFKILLFILLLIDGKQGKQNQTDSARKATEIWAQCNLLSNQLL